MQPVYAALGFKIEARDWNVATYRRLTGNYAIPHGLEYWTLANEQPPHDGSEISQMVASGLITKDQFHGVDRSREIIVQNKVWHPNAHWYEGEWLDMIMDNAFNPACVYLDTTGTAGYSGTADLVTRTMQRCPPACVLLINVMLDDPRRGTESDPQVLLQNIADRCTAVELSAWGWEDIEAFEYKSSHTRMLTAALHRRV